MNKKALIDTLNSLTVGQFSTIQSRLDEVRAATREAGLDEIATILDEARSALDEFDLKSFRKRVQHAVSRLGHVRDETASLATKLPPGLDR